MSNPVSNVEIEDVLSSIRRLVAQSEPQEQAVKEPAKEALPEDGGMDRLVLTPAFRVLERDDTDAASDAQTHAESQPDFAETDRPADADTAEIAQAAPESSSEPTSETKDVLLNLVSDTAPELAAATDTMAEDAPLELSQDDQIADEATQNGSDDPETAPVAEQIELDDAYSKAAQSDQARAEVIWENGEAHVETLNGQRADLMATIAELEAAVSSQPEEWEPDGSEAQPVMDWSATPDTERRAPRLHLSVEDAVMADDTPVETAETASEVHNTAEPSLDAAVADDTVVELPKAAAPEAQEPVADLPNDQDSDLAAYLDGENLIDEEALRDMVAEIVRNELQGVLGERITRNVRKLVRREIYRILSSQDFE